jgi:Asp-tRNA(Asn)/Glu-tRNA(Gln) amidotransferase A subunit family amidase
MASDAGDSPGGNDEGASGADRRTGAGQTDGVPPEADFDEADLLDGQVPPSIPFSGDLPMPRRLDERLPFQYPDASELLQSMRDGRQTASALLDEHLARIERDRSRLNAATRVLSKRAIAEAAAPRPGPLSGLPISVKETIALAGLHITAGSTRMPPVEVSSDAEAVSRLREAGAVVLARGNVPELGLAGETENPRFGRTSNPLDVTRTCGGSSGGDAALVASGGVAAALASDMFGSIRIPAAFCGVVGYKPASAAIPKRGAWPPVKGFLDRWHAVGPITRSVRDARLFTEVLAGPLPLPPLLEDIEFVIPDPFPLKLQQPAIQSAWQRAERALELAGLRRVTLDFEEIGDLTRDVGAVIAAEMGSILEQFLVTDTGDRFTVLGETWRRMRGRASVYDGVYKLMRALPLVRVRGAGREEALLKRYLQARDRFVSLLGPGRLLLLPTLGMLAPAHGMMNRETLRPGLNESMTPLVMCNFLDLASIALPAWSDRDPRSGLPPSIMLAGAPGTEPALFAAATALEKVLGVPGHADLAGREPRLPGRVASRR